MCFDQNDLYLLQIQNGYRQHTNGSVFINLNYSIIKLIFLWKSRKVDSILRKIWLQGIRNYVEAHYILICFDVRDINHQDWKTVNIHLVKSE